MQNFIINRRRAASICQLRAGCGLLGSRVFNVAAQFIDFSVVPLILSLVFVGHFIDFPH